ncbi:MAG TPA: hypothetical protein VII23_20535 [Terriglobales bacterium]
MHLTANAETIDRLVEQGALLLQAFHAEHENGPAGCEAEFLRGEFAGWRSTLHTQYHDCAEEIVDRVLTKTGLPIPSGYIAADVGRPS